VEGKNTNFSEIVLPGILSEILSESSSLRALLEIGERIRADRRRRRRGRRRRRRRKGK